MKPSDEKYRVSIWVGFDKGDPEADVLKDLCGVRHYDLDHQEIIIDDRRWKMKPVKSLLKELSYSSSFLSEALAAAKEQRIDKALYVVAQYRFVYRPRKTRKKIAAEPRFLGCFTWNDDESAELIAKCLKAMRS